eukprot:m.711476 g.711476  ORF g.711476 m.711476 type:complete len:262 (+) comp22952_c1_seq4:398-1183(+)
MAATFSAKYEEQLAAMKERARLAAEQKKAAKKVTKQKGKTNKNSRKALQQKVERIETTEEKPQAIETIGELIKSAVLVEAAQSSAAPTIVQWTHSTSRNADVDVREDCNDDSTKSKDSVHVSLLSGHNFSVKKSDTSVFKQEGIGSSTHQTIDADSHKSTTTTAECSIRTPKSTPQTDSKSNSKRINVVISPGSCGRDEMYPAHKKVEVLSVVMVACKPIDADWINLLLRTCLCTCCRGSARRETGLLMSASTSSQTTFPK